MIYTEQWMDSWSAVLIGREFPDYTDTRWHTFTGEHEWGKQQGDIAIAGEHTREIHERLASADFVAALADQFAIPDLVADPSRKGGGIHQCAPGGFLDLHVDFNLSDDGTLVRAVNVIVFVSEYGIGADDPGALILKVCDQTIRMGADPGRLVAWTAEDDIYHGHPEPMTADQPRRRSIPAYYFRPLREGEEVAGRSTTWL